MTKRALSQAMCPICKKMVIPVIWTSQPIKVCPDCGNVIETIDREEPTDCACLDSNARRCFEKRYIGTTPENEYAMRQAQCECPCHYEPDDDCDCHECNDRRIV